MSKSQILSSFDSRNFDLRTDEDHMNHLRQLKDLEGPEKVLYQRQTGVMTASPFLTDLKKSSISLALQDPMHLLLEVKLK
jgi:hypothetical protein